MNDDISNPEEVVKAMIKFMNQTNEHLKMLQLRIDNQQIDIDKLRKDAGKNNRLVKLV